MRRNAGKLLLSGLLTIAALPCLTAKPGQDSSSSSESSSKSKPPSDSNSNPAPDEKSSKSKKGKKRQAAPQTTVVDTEAPLPPDSPEKDIEVAQYYIRKGDPDAAIPRLQEAIRENPKLAKPRLMLAEVYEKKGDAPDAVRCYKEYLQVFPTAPDAKRIEKKIQKLSGE